ncbi:hypothetical protein [Blastococcus sp. SYSU DS1021]
MRSAGTPANGGRDGEGQIAAFGEELAHVRARGLDSLDLRLSGHGPVITPILDLLARSYCDTWTGARVPLIELLLTNGLAAWRAQGCRSEPEVIERLFFARVGTPPKEGLPGPLFDAARYIRVFPGVGPDDLIRNGTFTDSQTALAVCKTTGRLVVSDPSVGERPRQSDVWIQVIGSPGLTQFAPLTYGDIDQAALDQLPQCENVP